MLDLQWIWLIAFIVFVIIEIPHQAIGAIFFAFGSLLAIIAAIAGAVWPVQVAIFLVGSIVSLLLLRPILRSKLIKPKVPMNAESVPGRVVAIVETVNNLHQTGRAKLNDVEWSTRTVFDNVIIEAGDLAKVVEVRGTRLIVEPITEPTESTEKSK